MPRFSETLLEYARYPPNAGRLEPFDAQGIAGRFDRPPYVIIQLRFSAGRISEARFQAGGCGATVAASSVVTELIINQLPATCLSITRDDVIKALDGMPPDKMYCVDLAISAMLNALANAVN